MVFELPNSSSIDCCSTLSLTFPGPMCDERQNPIYDHYVLDRIVVMPNCSQMVVSLHEWCPNLQPTKNQVSVHLCGYVIEYWVHIAGMASRFNHSDPCNCQPSDVIAPNVFTMSIIQTHWFLMSMI